MKILPTHLNEKKTYLPLSASLIAGFLLAAGPKQAVVAQEVQENTTLSEIKALHTQYHSLLSENQVEETTEETQEEPESSFVNDSEELNQIKQLLLATIEKVGSTEFVEQLQVENLTIEDLNVIFERLTSEVALTEEVVAEETEEVLEDAVQEEEIVQEEEVVLEADISEVIEPEQELEPEIEPEELVEEVSTEPVEVHSEEVVEVAPVEEKAATHAPQVASVMATSARVTSTASTQKESTVIHTVKSGENLNQIGRRYGVSADHIAALNNLPNKNNIQIGQQLLITGSQEDLSKLNRPLTNTEFINVIGEHAREVASSNNLYASVMVAQAALESGFGKSTLSSAPNHNLFGIKGTYKGDSVTMQTKEYYNSTGWITINDKFRKYPSYKESLLDNAYILRNGTSWDSTFYAGTWLENAKTFQEATSWLQGRYATDPTYANKLNNLIATYNLTRFDTPYQDLTEIVEEIIKEVKPSTGSQKPADTNNSSNTNTTTYTVKSGDTLSRIARVYNTSVSELKSLNNLRSDLIRIGQKLKVNSSAGASNSAPATPTPAPTPAPSTSTPSSSDTYTVKRGDTLTHIALRNGMRVSELKSLNNLRSDLIIVGQTLKVKAKTSTPAPKPSAPTNSTTPSSSTSTGTYTVKSGDTLSAISRRHNTSVSELKTLNNLRSDLIFVGQTLKVKGQSTTPAPKPTTPSSSSSNATSTSATTYTVKSGDTLSGISRRYNTTVSELKRLNNLKSDLIFVNQRLTVKAGTKSVTPASSSNSAASNTTKPSSTSNTANTHVVKSGETLSGIAKRYNTSVSNIVSLNKLANANLIRVNQRLIVGQSTSSQSKAPSTNTGSTQNHSKTHRVVAGDTLFELALRNNTTVSALKNKNNLTSDLIFVGQTLNI